MLFQKISPRCFYTFSEKHHKDAENLLLAESLFLMGEPPRERKFLFYENGRERFVLQNRRVQKHSKFSVASFGDKTPTYFSSFSYEGKGHKNAPRRKSAFDENTN